MLGAEGMQSGRWALFILDLIGGGAVGAALIYVATLRRRRSQRDAR
jgi:membrane-associated phospholipid phosphatase